MSLVRWLLGLLLLLLCAVKLDSFRVLQPGQTDPDDPYFKPYDKGFVGVFGEPSNKQRERVNEGAFETATQELLYESNNPRQACPGMVGPFSDGNFYCTAREYGYCDKRSGACFCNPGYGGLDCSECIGSHFRLGTLCAPKELCPNDCSGAGSCNFLTGTCTCQSHRIGADCGTMLCTNFSSQCETCTSTECLRCIGGYYLTGNDQVCGSCYEFDPRCAGCTLDEGCTVCADPLLTSVRRSGYRANDPRLPFEEDTRELSISLPFGTKSVESFAEAEHYLVVPGYSEENPLSQNSSTCVQGENDDDTWNCLPKAASHKVCGHFGVFKFAFPNYVINEDAGELQLSVSRSGGGYGDVFVSYFINHFTTNDSDVSATAIYTTSQTLEFYEGIVEKNFSILILDDNLLEADEVFQVVLEVPDGGGSLGPQFRTNVTIIDNDAGIFSSSLSYVIANQTHVPASSEFYVMLQATDAKNESMTQGSGENFLVVIENNMATWDNPGTSSGTMRHSTRKTGSVTASGDGSYKLYSSGINEQGKYQMRAWHAFPGGLRGQYYYDAFFENLALERFDKTINFNWGRGKIAPHSIDYVTVRWTGCLMTSTAGWYEFKVEADDHSRFWLDGDILLDHWHEMSANLEMPRKKYLEANKMYELVLEYRDVRGPAFCSLMWAQEGNELEVIQANNFYSLYELNKLSPTEVVVYSGPTDASKTECTGEGIFDAMAGMRSTFKVCPRDSYYNFRDDDDEIYLASELFSGTLTLQDDLGYNGVGAETITVTFTYDHGEHCFLAEYTPLIAGSYELSVLFQEDPDASTNHVAGSPFDVAVVPNEAFGPYSVINGLSSSVETVEAGNCINFTILAKDAYKNKVNSSGTSLFSVYTYQVDFVQDSAEVQGNYSAHNSSHSYVRYGTVYDKSNGTYEVELCPVLQGTHEIHVLLDGNGVSNQPERIMDPANSRAYGSAMGTHLGQYVHDSPYHLSVTHSAPNAFTSTAQGSGLEGATVLIPAYVMVTVRDSWDNVLRPPSSYTPSVTALLDRSPSASVSIYNMNNGSYMITYIAESSDLNLLSILVGGQHIKHSPFTVPIMEAVVANHDYSVATGRGLHVGTVGQPSYFQVFAYDSYGNRRTSTGDNFTFTVQGDNFLNGTMQPCPKPPSFVSGAAKHPVCDSYDLEEGHYFGVFYPSFTSVMNTSYLDVYLTNATNITVDGDIVTTERVAGSPWSLTIYPADPSPSNIDIFGDIYDTIAGKTATMNIDLRDRYNNLLISGGYAMELVLYGVASEWGTIVPWGTTPGLPNAYHYTGFYTEGALDFYGNWLDQQNGSLVVTHNATITGQYVTRYSIAVPGLNATYFNTTETFGYLHDDNFNPVDDSRYEDTFGARPLNLATSISWTGDIGGRPNEGDDSTLGGRGGLGQGSYYHMFKSREETNVDFDLTEAYASRELGYEMETKSAFTREEKFRESYWSVRYTGMIKPTFRENYRFKVEVDPYSTVRLFVGGRGTAINGSLGDATAQQVLHVGDSLSNFAEVSSTSGYYNFTDTNTREIVLEYIHHDGDSFLKLLWESASTPLQVVPATAFTHWVNISHHNTTVHPAELSPIHSTAYGDALTTGTVGTLHSFHVYARDEFRNLRQVGGEVPSMVAVGHQGAMFRGNVTDYGNSTYLIEYYATVAGNYRMYVTVGCCPSHPNVGLSAELRDFDELLVEGAPFRLAIAPNIPSPSETTAMGEGVVGSVAGTNQTFTVLLRDLHGNPTTLGDGFSSQNAYVRVVFTDLATGRVFDDSAEVDSISYSALSSESSSVEVTYNLSRAGEYSMAVYFGTEAHGNGTYIDESDDIEILGSPYRVRVVPSAADASKSIARGLGMRQAAFNITYNFEVQLFDAYSNNLITGGDKLYVRLTGDGSYRKSEVIVPRCQDTLNGRYRCAYVARREGYHELDVRVLRASTNQPGGLGLKAIYFNGPEVSLAEAFADQDSASLVATRIARVDSTISFSWPTGMILPLSAAGDQPLMANNSMGNSTAAAAASIITGKVGNGYGTAAHGMDPHLAALRRNGQSVMWTGFVVPPRSEHYHLQLRLVGMSGSIYVDDVLIFDSQASISESIHFQSGSAYAITIKASVINSESLAPTAIDLLWRTPTVRWSKVPRFFLYDSAEPIYLSPFPVTVGPDPTPAPTSMPSGQPSGQPSARPSGQPSGQPSAQPSGQPSGQPSTEPSSKPTTS